MFTILSGLPRSFFCFTCTQQLHVRYYLRKLSCQCGAIYSLEGLAQNQYKVERVVTGNAPQHSPQRNPLPVAPPMPPAPRQNRRPQQAVNIRARAIRQLNFGLPDIGLPDNSSDSGIDNP